MSQELLAVEDVEKQKYKFDFEDFEEKFPIIAEDKQITETMEFFSNLFFEDVEEVNKWEKGCISTLGYPEIYGIKNTSYFYSLDTLLDRLKYLVNGVNIYFSYNYFKFDRGKIRRQVDYLSKIHCLALDIDFKEQTLKPYEILDILKNRLNIKPMYVVSSGNGYHVYFKVASCKVKRGHTINFFNKIDRAIRMYLQEEFNIVVDKQTVQSSNRMLRVPNTYNLKIEKDDMGKEIRIPKEVCIIHKDIESSYTLDKLFIAVKKYYNRVSIESIKENKKLKKAKKENINKIKELEVTDRKFISKYLKLLRVIKLNTYGKPMKNGHTLATLFECRREDYLKFLELREWNITGLRHSFFYYYLMNELNLDRRKNRILKDKSHYKKILYELNNKLKEPQDIDDLNNSIEYIFSNYTHRENAFISITNRRIIEHFGITREEQKQLKTLIGAEEKKERKDLRNKKYYKENKEYFREYYKNKYKEKYKKELRKKYEKKLKDEGKKTQAKEMEKRKKAILKLLRKGITSNKEIANILGVSSKTIQRDRLSL